MSFTTQERINAVAKALLGGVLDADPGTQWYESTMPFGFVLNSTMVWTQGTVVKGAPAANLAIAQAFCAAGTGALDGIVQDHSTPATAIRLTAMPGVSNTYVALATYGDFSSAYMDNWLKPQFVPQTNGQPSFGYAMRLFNGDPNAGGVEIGTTDGTTGVGPLKSVGWVWNYDNGLLLLASDFAALVPDPYIMAFRYVGTTAGSGGGGGASLAVYDEGNLVNAAVTEINFIGADVLAHKAGLPAGRVDVYIPAPPFLSHWNTADGSNGLQGVTESIVRTTTRISTPNAGEGSPFKTGGWAGSNHDTTLTGPVTFTTPADTSGFGGDSKVLVEVFDADGTTVLDSFLTPVITGNAVLGSPSDNIYVTITNYGPDIFRFKAHMVVSVDAHIILGDAGYQGGRYHVRITHTPDSVTDGNPAMVYTQPDVFFDTNPGALLAISSTVTIAETVGSILTKHLSGVEFYILNSQFTANIQGIDRLNANAIKTAGNLLVVGTEYGMPTLSQCPFGTGAANFVGWTNNDNVNGVQYLQTNWAITTPSYRYMGPSGNITAQPVDPWASGLAKPSADAPILVDTFVASSTALAEYFNDEAWREDPASFPGTGSWDSTHTLVAGEAQVWNGQLYVPGQTTYVRSDGALTVNSNWTTYKPNLGGANPNYTGLTVPVSYGRRFTKAAGANIPSMSVVFSGTFAAGNALADMVAGNLEIYVYRIAGIGFTGAPPANTHPLRVHLPFSFALWDDGVTLAGSGIREASSATNTINCTFGTGTPADTGFYCVVKILNVATRIDSMVVTFY